MIRCINALRGYLHNECNVTVQFWHQKKEYCKHISIKALMEHILLDHVIDKAKNLESWRF